MINDGEEGVEEENPVDCRRRSLSSKDAVGRRHDAHLTREFERPFFIGECMGIYDCCRVVGDTIRC